MENDYDKLVLTVAVLKVELEHDFDVVELAKMLLQSGLNPDAFLEASKNRYKNILRGGHE